MKNIRLWIIAAAIMLALLCAGAASAETIASGNCGAEGDNVAWTLDSEGVLTITGTGAMKDYIIVDFEGVTNTPWKNYLNEMKSAVIIEGITNIGDCTFYGCSSLTSIAIPDSVTGIGDFAFYGCSSLTSIAIPDSVTGIGDFAFCGCSSLTSIAIPDGVTYISDGAFYGCGSLTSIVIPDGITGIGDDAFFGCSSLTSVVIPDSVTGIGDGAFSGCGSLTSIAIPDSVTGIGNEAFSGCSSLTSIVIPDSVTSIGGWAFYNCSSLTSIVISDGVTGIERYAFNGCYNLTNIYCYEFSYAAEWAKNNGWSNKIRYLGGVTDSDAPVIAIPKAVTEIAEETYINTAVEVIRLPETCTKINARAFANCAQLRIVEIPASAVDIADDAFADSPNVVIVTHEGSAAQQYARVHGIPYLAYPAN